MLAYIFRYCYYVLLYFCFISTVLIRLCSLSYYLPLLFFGKANSVHFRKVSGNTACHSAFGGGVLRATNGTYTARPSA